MSRGADLWLAARSVLWTLLLPGVIGHYVPWRYLGLRDAVFDASDPLHWLAALVIAIGATILGVCIFEFARSGKGTLSPLDAPKVLVVRGLYRYVRNPMYVGVTTVVMGYALLTRTSTMLSYAGVVFVGFNLFVLGYEQPALTRMFGEQYVRYCAAVPMWIPRLRPWRP